MSSWNGNIAKERVDPLEILLGAMDYRKCPLLHLAVYFESLADRKRNPKTDTFGFENPHNKYLAVRKALNTIIDSKYF